MIASKYMPFLFPIPLLIYAWARKTGTAWRIGVAKWFKLLSLSIGAFLALDFVVFFPSTWRYLFRYMAGDRVGDRASSETLWFMGRLYNNLVFHYTGGTPSWFHLIFAAVKLTPPVAILVVVGLVMALKHRSFATGVLIIWSGYFLFVFAIFSGKYGRYFIPLLPCCFLLGAYGWVQLSRTIRLTGRRLALGLIAAVAFGNELSASIHHAPYYRLYISPLGGGDRQLDYFFPHCDYFDAGVREAIGWINVHAEPHSEIATEVEWVAQYYATLGGRTDLTTEPVLPKTACRGGNPCYVVVQSGRLYSHNQAALEFLQHTAPVHQVSVASATPVQIYKLNAGISPFPDVAGRPVTQKLEGH